MSFRFVWLEADTPEELEMLRATMSEFIGSSQKKSAKTRSEINREYYERSKEKSEIQTEKSLKKSEKSLKKSEIQTNSDEIQTFQKEKEEKEKSSKKEKEEKEILINTSANAEVQRGENRTAEQQASRKTATPDDSEYWAFARDNAEMAEAFHRETGLVPIKSQFGRWINDLRDLAEAGISVEQMRKTVQYMLSENLPICAPGSLLKTAQWLKARGSVPVKSKKGPAPGQPDRWDKAAENLKAEMISSDIFGFLGNPQEVIDV